MRKTIPPSDSSRCSRYKLMVRYGSVFRFVFLTVWLVASGVVYAQDSKLVRVSYIKAEKAEKFFVDKRIRSLEKPLREAKASKKNHLKAFNRFTPLEIVDKQTIQFGMKQRIKINKSMFVELTLQPLKKNYYPATVRWFTVSEKEKKTEKEIVKAKEYKFFQDRCLFIGKSTSEKATTAELLVIEFIKPEKKK